MPCGCVSTASCFRILQCLSVCSTIRTFIWINEHHASCHMRTLQTDVPRRIDGFDKTKDARKPLCNLAGRTSRGWAFTSKVNETGNGYLQTSLLVVTDKIDLGNYYVNYTTVKLVSERLVSASGYQQVVIGSSFDIATSRCDILPIVPYKSWQIAMFRTAVTICKVSTCRLVVLARTLDRSRT